jgi:hypothetical protein
MVNLKTCGGKIPWINLRHCPCMKGLSKFEEEKNLIQES